MEPRIVRAIPTMVVAAYVSGDVVGTEVLRFARALGQGESGDVVSVSITDKANVGPDFRLHLFGVAPTASFGADNAALAMSAADVLAQKWLHTIPISTANFIGLSASIKKATVPGLLLPILGISTDTDMYGILEARGAYTPTGVDSLVVDVTIHPHGRLM